LENLEASLKEIDDQTARRAVMNDYPVARDDGSASGQWEIKNGDLPGEGCEFFLLFRQTGEILGAGHARGGGILELENGAQPAIDAAKEHDFLLVLVVSPSPPEP
jgi:hypothetical protein